MNTYVIPDLHGEYDKFVKLLLTIDYNPQQDKLIFLGDYIDRGPDSYELVSTLLVMYSLYPDKIHILRGNHEQLAYDYVTKGEKFNFYNNGGRHTINSYPTEEVFEEHIKFLGNLPVCLETDNFVFVHAGFKPKVDLHSN